MQGDTGVQVFDLGTNSNAAGATLTLTSVTVPSGALVVVLVAENTSASAGSLADGTNGAYSTATSGAMSAAAGFGMLFYFQNSAALTNATITYTKQTSGTRACLSAFYVTGIATASALDGAFTATSAVNSASPTVTSAAAPANDGSLIVGGCCYSNASPRVLTNTGSFAVPFANVTTQATPQCGGGHIDVGGTVGTYTFNPTLAAASDNITMIVAFKPAAAPTVGWWGKTKWATSTTYVTGNLVRQNATPANGNERMFVCIASTGGTGQSGATEPTWTTTRGATTTDNTVTWQEATGIAALNGDLTNTPNWTTVKNTNVVAGQVIKNNAGNLILIATTQGLTGNGAEPSWSAYTAAGASTTDNVVVWRTLGASFGNWAAPHARVANSIAGNWGQTGNSFFIADNHNEVQTTALTWNFQSGTVASPNLVYCVDRTVATPPGSADLKTTAAVTTTGNSGITMNNSAYLYGLVLSCGSGANAPTFTCNGTNASWVRYDSCKLIGGATASQTLRFFGANGTFTELVNTTVKFNAAGSVINNSGSGRFIWRNTPNAYDASVVQPTNLFGNAAAAAPGLLEGIDLSSITSKTYVSAQSTTVAGSLVLKDCKLGTGYTLSAAQTGPGFVIDAIRCDSDGANYLIERHNYLADLTTDTGVYRTGGASDGTTSVSRKIVTAATRINWVDPFAAPIIVKENDVTGTPITVTVHATSNIAAGGFPNTDDIWLEVEYLGDASSPMGSFINNTKVNNLASASAYSTDGETWSGSPTGGTFAMAVTFTPQQKGYVYATVKCAKPSTTFYIDPLINFS